MRSPGSVFGCRLVGWQGTTYDFPVVYRSRVAMHLLRCRIYAMSYENDNQELARGRGQEGKENSRFDDRRSQPNDTFDRHSMLDFHHLSKWTPGISTTHPTSG